MSLAHSKRISKVYLPVWLRRGDCPEVCSRLCSPAVAIHTLRASRRERLQAHCIIPGAPQYLRSLLYCPQRLLQNDQLDYLPPSVSYQPRSSSGWGLTSGELFMYLAWAPPVPGSPTDRNGSKRIETDRTGSPGGFGAAARWGLGSQGSGWDEGVRESRT